MKIINFRGDFTDISAKKEALVLTLLYTVMCTAPVHKYSGASGPVLAELSVRSPRKLFIFNIEECLSRIKECKTQFI